MVASNVKLRTNDSSECQTEDAALNTKLKEIVALNTKL